MFPSWLRYASRPPKRTGVRLGAGAFRSAKPVSSPDTLIRRVSTRQRRWAGGALVVLGVTVVLAASLPVGRSETRSGSDATKEDVTSAAVAEEDLTAFLDTRRWGRSLREIHGEQGANDRANGINPVLAEMGYVGLIVSHDRSAMLLTLPDGEVARLGVGDRTPDGRTLSSITDNTLTLSDANGSAEVLELFPRATLEADG